MLYKKAVRLASLPAEEVLRPVVEKSDPALVVGQKRWIGKSSQALPENLEIESVCCAAVSDAIHAGRWNLTRVGIHAVYPPLMRTAMTHGITTKYKIPPNPPFPKGGRGDCIKGPISPK